MNDISSGQYNEKMPLISMKWSFSFALPMCRIAAEPCKVELKVKIKY